MRQVKAPRSIKAKSARVSEVSCHILLVKTVTGQHTDSRRGEIISSLGMENAKQLGVIFILPH